MKANWPKIISNLPLIFLLAIIAIPFVYIFFPWPIKSFWDNMMGNMLSTVLALIGGIPIALWINRFSQTYEENQKQLNNRKREIDILQLIKEELDFSYNSLFLNGKKGNSTSITTQPLKSSLWEALISSEDTKYIKDPKLLNQISSAYYVLKIIQNIEWQAHIALRTSAITFTSLKGVQSTSAQLLLQDARNFDVLFENNIKEALRVINGRLIELKKNEK